MCAAHSFTLLSPFIGLAAQSKDVYSCKIQYNLYPKLEDHGYGAF